MTLIAKLVTIHVYATWVILSLHQSELYTYYFLIKRGYELIDSSLVFVDNFREKNNITNLRHAMIIVPNVNT